MGKALSALKSQEEALRRAKEFAERVKKICEERGLRFVGAYLVGSRARGDYRVDSDIDIVIVVEGVEPMNQLERIELFSKVLLEVPGEIEYRVYTPSEWGSDSAWMKELRKEAMKIL